MSRGRPPVFKTPDELESLFHQYEADIRANPIKKRVYVGWQSRPEWLEVRRPLTVLGFEVWLSERGICTSGLGNYRRQSCKHHEQFVDVLRYIRVACNADMICGALVGVYNAQIVWRLICQSGQR